MRPSEVEPLDLGKLATTPTEAASKDRANSTRLNQPKQLPSTNPASANVSLTARDASDERQGTAMRIPDRVLLGRVVI